MKNYSNTSLISYEEKNNDMIIFSISDMSEIQHISMLVGLSQVPKEDDKISKIRFLASTYKNEFISDDDLEQKTILNIVKILSQNKEYSIDNLEVTLENKIEISVGEDNDLTFYFPKEYNYKEFIQKLLTIYEYNSETILPQLIENKNQYLAIEKPDKIIRKYKDFDEYWKSL